MAEFIFRAELEYFQVTLISFIEQGLVELTTLKLKWRFVVQILNTDEDLAVYAVLQEQTLSRTDSVDKTSSGPTSRNLVSSDTVQVTLPRWRMAERMENMLHGTNKHTNRCHKWLLGGITHLAGTSSTVEAKSSGQLILTSFIFSILVCHHHIRQESLKQAIHAGQALLSQFNLP